MNYMVVLILLFGSWFDATAVENNNNTNVTDTSSLSICITGTDQTTAHAIQENMETKKTPNQLTKLGNHPVVFKISGGNVTFNF